MRIRVAVNTLGDLASDMASKSASAPRRLSGVVRKNTAAGNLAAQRLARAKAGKHGKNYWKRISGEMRGPLTGEYGPTGTPKSDFVGVGFRHGINLDLPNSADLIAPKFAQDALDAGDCW